MRIVSLSPSLTEILPALKAEGDLVGVSDLCEPSRKDLPRTGSPKVLEFSVIDSLAPDWILADSQDNRPEEIERLQLKHKVKLFEVKGPEGVLDALAELGRLIGKTREASVLIEAIQGEVRQSREIFQDRPKKRTLLLVWDTPYLTVNFDSYPSRLLEASGGLNVFREESVREFPVELEEMIRKEPEVLFLSGEPAPFRKKHVAEFRRYRIFSKIPIRLIQGRHFSHYGLQTKEALQDLRKIYEGLSG